MEIDPFLAVRRDGAAALPSANLLLANNEGKSPDFGRPRRYGCLSVADRAPPLRPRRVPGSRRRGYGYRPEAQHGRAASRPRRVPLRPPLSQVNAAATPRAAVGSPRVETSKSGTSG